MTTRSILGGVAGDVVTSSTGEDAREKKILLTGATGFVGHALLPRLLGQGWAVRAVTRRLRPPAQLSETERRVEWVEGTVEDRASDVRFLRGVDVALYLVHAMSEGADFEKREKNEARTFAEAAAQAGVGHIVYLGGVAPAGQPSPHLRSRLRVGEILRSGSVPTIELRASMIIGQGSISWLIVRDLAARLPVMVLPAWLNSRTQPVGLDDVLTALVAAVARPLSVSASFDLPGPEVLTGRQILDESARQMELPPPRAVEVPLLSPSFSSHWVRLVTRANWAVARELIEGLQTDLLARDDSFWREIEHPQRLPFAEASRRALDGDDEPGGLWGVVERLRHPHRRTST